MPIGDVLELIESSLREHWPSTAESLQPPVTLQQLDRAQDVMKIHLPMDVARLYLWHDGANATGTTFEIAPTFSFISLDRALDIWAELNQARKDGIFGFSEWKPCWLPIGSDVCGRHILVEMSGDTAGRIFEYSFIDGPFLMRAGSLCMIGRRTC
jgi:cell wall assembly regulator SMI1